jgi:hypothetical protein
MIVPLLTLIAVGLSSYAGFLKLAARLLRYSVSWKSSFTFAGIIMVAVIFHHVLLFSAPVALRIGLGVILLLGLVILGGWFFSGRGTNRLGSCLGRSGGIRLMALAFAMMIVVAFTIAMPTQFFLYKHLSPSP